MENTGAVTDEAKRLNDERVTYQGGAAAAERLDERRSLIKLCRADEFLDELHLQDCIEETATWAPDVMRQKMLRKMGGAMGRGKIIQPGQFDELLAQVRRNSDPPGPSHA